MTIPGVYIEEGGSGPRVIAGVPTAVTAFVGTAMRGPADVPVRITSIVEYERTFGGRTRTHPMSWSVFHFFQNGGRDAVVVRLVRGAAAATGRVETLGLVAASPGAWGNALRARVEHAPVVTPGEELFHLTVRDTATGVTERFEGLSVSAAHPRFVQGVLAGYSMLVRVAGAVPAGRPAASPDAALGADPMTVTPGSVAFDADGSDGSALTDAEVSGAGLEESQRGMWALETVPRFNLLCIPPYSSGSGGDIGGATRSAATRYCERRGAFFIADPLTSWTTAAQVLSNVTGIDTATWGMARSANAAVYFPRIVSPDPESGVPQEFAPSGAIAGVMARVDGTRGVWKAPAGSDGELRGVTGLSVTLDDGEMGQLNRIAVNSLRRVPPTGYVAWGARTLVGRDDLGSEWKYVPVRRLALYIEASVGEGTQWAVFEPNAEPLWGAMRVAIEGFLNGLFRQGALAGATAREAYFVRCDATTTTLADVAAGVANVEIGFAPLRPAEFVVLTLRLRTAS